MKKSSFHIKAMDCPSEENLIRMKLEDNSTIKGLSFDLNNRTLDVFHISENETIIKALDSLKLGTELTSINDVVNFEVEEESTQRKTLWTVLIINFGFFIIEMTTGFISKSIGLVADSLDMLADSLVYGLSLMVVGTNRIRKKKIARVSGYFQIALGLIGFIEVLRRFMGLEMVPDFKTMIIVSILALIGNAACLFLLKKSKSEEAHMKASMIFTSNDVIINLGVIIAGVLVMYFDSNKPDLLIGSIVFIIVLRGAFRILSLSRT